MRPDYGLLTFRDVDLDARVGIDDAIVTAGRTVAAATEYEICVRVAQLDLPVLARLEVWDTAPTEPPTSLPWELLGSFVLPFPTGHVLLGDGSGQVIDGPWLPRTPGTYQCEVWTTGRTDVHAVVHHIDHVTHGFTIPDKIRYQDEHGSGVEKYLIRAWWVAPMDDETDD